MGKGMGAVPESKQVYCVTTLVATFCSWQGLDNCSTPGGRKITFVFQVVPGTS